MDRQQGWEHLFGVRGAVTTPQEDAQRLADAHAARVVLASRHLMEFCDGVAQSYAHNWNLPPREVFFLCKEVLTRMGES